jgi:hypothetical protein
LTTKRSAELLDLTAPIGRFRQDVIRSVREQEHLCSLQAHKESSAISGTSAAIWTKTKFGPTGHHHLRRSPLLRVCTSPSAFALFFNASWKSCSVRVFITACDSASIVSKWRLFSFIFNRETEKSRVGGGQQSCCLW